MIEFKPFKGFVYNKDLIGDLSQVVCPPYDVINEKERRAYAAKDSNNLIHILLSQEENGLDKYKVASKKFEELINSNVLTQDTEPAIYFYDHQYRLNNETKARLGFIALLKIDDQAKVYPHENTHLPAKLDRLQLLNHVKANLSPIFVMFSDREKLLRKIFEERLKNSACDIKVIDNDGACHKIWKVTDKEILALLRKHLSDKPIFIADGHHRYEVAKQFRQKMINLSKNSSGEENFNYIMSYFTDVESSDMTILAIHRLVKAKLLNKNIKEALNQFFEIKELANREELSSLMRANAGGHIFGLYDGKTYFLKLRADDLIEKNIDLDKSLAYKRLDVTILKYLILRPLFGDSEVEVQYTIKINEAYNLIDEKKFELAIFVNPIDINELLEVASGQEKMPQKSTYFYPKVLSGLVIHNFVE